MESSRWKVRNDLVCGDQLPKAYEDVVIIPDILEETPESLMSFNQESILIKKKC